LRLMTEPYSRHIKFENVINFRDLGGYRARDGYTVAWRRLFRSGEFRDMTENDLSLLTGEIGLTSVIDLRSSMEIEHRGVGLIAEADIRYHNISFIAGGNREEDERLFKEITNMGQFYVHLVRHSEFGGRIVNALEIIAEPENHPLVFHCAIGKDRTGILAAVLLSVLGVRDEDIIEDYTLSTPYMEELLRQINSNPEMAKNIEPLPHYFWEATPESMSLFLSTLRREYGSVIDYLKAQGAEPSLVQRLEKALLT
jgi:protein-tyrosine phosphatase